MADLRETGQQNQLVENQALILKRLQEGGLVRGIEQASGPLVQLTGMALERITRERVGTPPELKLPERAVYLLDTDSRRLIMISNREPKIPLEDLSKWEKPKYGLFAEVIELDEDGSPRYGLDSSKAILPDALYQPVAIGPNEHGLPPSHIEVQEEKAEESFIPWNEYLARAEDWLNKLRIDPSEDFETFRQRFLDLKEESGINVQAKIREAFPSSIQSITDKMVPLNVILTDKGKDSHFYKASLDAGFYPLIIDLEDLALYFEKVGFKTPSEIRHSLPIIVDVLTNVCDRESRDLLARGINLGEDAFNLRDTMLKLGGGRIDVSPKYDIAVVTSDLPAIDEKYFASNEKRYAALQSYPHRDMPEYNHLFASIMINRWNDNIENTIKTQHGEYECPRDNIDEYRRLLNAVRASFILTMFVRGGAPIVK